jgi:hypothetical protein
MPDHALESILVDIQPAQAEFIPQAPPIILRSSRFKRQTTNQRHLCIKPDLIEFEAPFSPVTPIWPAIYQHFMN